SKVSTSGVSIVMKPVKKKPGVSTPVSLSSQSTVVEATPDPVSCSTKPLVQKGMRDYFIPNRKGVYTEVISTTDSDTEDKPEANIIKKIQPGATYVIYYHKGSHFPGLVTKLTKKRIYVKSMKKSSLKTWSWPEQDDLV
ncbi:unnamed protein product, partial [Meganyctiphanes norvegica]